MSLDFFNTNISCFNKSEPLVPIEFVHSACWIQGFYTFAELSSCTKQCGYFGIPQNIKMDGKKNNDVLCDTEKEKDCLPMTKVFFHHYQYFPFYIGSLAILYYLPYIFFRAINTDIVNLKTYIKSNNNTKSPKTLSETYFNYKMNGGRSKLRAKVILNIGVKMLYVGVNAFGFLFTNQLLKRNYLSYGIDWIKWAQLNNTLVFDYSGSGNLPKPGDSLLPAIALCEIPAASNDKRYQFVNKHKFICEISPNVMYQYVMVVLWFIFTSGILVSLAGFILSTSSHFLYFFSAFLKCKVFLKNPNVGLSFFNLTIREIEYLNQIRNNDVTLYKEVLSFLKKTRFKRTSKKEDTEDIPKQKTHIKSGRYLFVL